MEKIELEQLPLMDLEEVLIGISQTDKKNADAAWEHWDGRCKPLRGFGKLEEIVVKLAAIQGTAFPKIDKRAIVIMGADNGVVEEGVSQTGQDVTVQVLENMGDLKSSVCIMSRILHAEVFPVNIGSVRKPVHSRVLNIPVRDGGTDNIAKGPAMTEAECREAICKGIAVVGALKAAGYELVITGEMGIGNTTTSAACAACLFEKEPAFVTGRGAGLSSAGLEKKVRVVGQAIEVNRPDRTDAIDVMKKIGGFDIAGMTGLFLGAAYYRMPALIDGFISGISACFASMLCPASVDYMFATHATAEPAGKLVHEFLGLDPILFAGMHLGEATGAAAVLPLFDQALNVYRNLPGWNDGKVEAYEHLK